MKFGVVKFWSQGSWGFVTGDDGVDYFVHYTRIAMDGHRELAKGQQVRFEVERSEKGLMAVNVVPIGYFTSDSRRKR